MSEPASNTGSYSTRFKKGQSGNPRGRPKKKPAAKPSAFDVVIDRTLTIVQGGVEREVTVDEALQHKTYQEAIAGSRAARREVLKMIAKREKATTDKAPRYRPPEVRIESTDPRNADEAMLILGIACHDPKWTEPIEPGDPQRLQIATWAAQAALSRRSGSKLTKRDIEELKRCTLASEGIDWPEPVEQ